MKIYKASVASNGTVTTTSALNTAQLVEDGSLRMYTTGFAFTIPNNEQYQRQPLYFAFNTFFNEKAEDIKSSEMKNSVNLRGSHEAEDQVNNVVAGSGLNFKWDVYAKASVAPYISIIKTSDKTAGAGTTNPATRLAKAEFSLVPVTYEARSETITTNPALKIVKSTNNNGLVSFRCLKMNMLYQLEETKAPVGYKRPTTKYYVIFNPKTAAYPDNTTVVTYGSGIAELRSCQKKFITQ